LEGKVALVTGGSKGIGRAISLAFAEHGADVAIAARDVDAIESTCAELRRFGKRVVGVSCNLAKDSEAETLHRQVVEELGPIDILVNNAAMVRPAELRDLTYARFDTVMRMNAWVPLRLAQLCYPAMRDKNEGVLIFVSSNGGIKPDPHIGAYSPSKAAMRMISMQLAQEWAADGIRSTCIAPGLTRTATAGALVDELEAAGFPQNMQRRAADPDEIAGMALLLASPAGSFCHGETYVVDGGELFRATT
jgi:NAD(P)-dependent dehydrogenase (short-subunit alcohol dehydrogenase family)